MYLICVSTWAGMINGFSSTLAVNKIIIQIVVTAWLEFLILSCFLFSSGYHQTTKTSPSFLICLYHVNIFQ